MNQILDQEMSQLEILDFMYSKHLVSPSNTIRALKNAGIDLSHGITVEDLIPYDHDHFGGVEETRRCLMLLSIERSANVLDIGSGLGGPARFMADHTGCRVTGVEIQRDRFEAAERFTKAVKLEQLVCFINDDFISAPLGEGSYTHVVSFLSILHMIDKNGAIGKVGRVLKKGGRVFIEDYYGQAGISDTDQSVLLETISCPGLMSMDEYTKTLEDSGLRICELSDETDCWRKIVKERAEHYNDDLVTLSRTFGLQAALSAVSFAEGVMKIFDKGLIGGIRVIAERR